MLGQAAAGSLSQQPYVLVHHHGLHFLPVGSWLGLKAAATLQKVAGCSKYMQAYEFGHVLHLLTVALPRCTHAGCCGRPARCWS